MAGTVAGTVTGAAVGAVVALAVAGGGAAAAAGAPAQAADRAPGWVPPGDTVVAVSGDADNGFTIEHHDGTTLHPPTLSEATAECGEYDAEVQVAVCVAEVETWYRDLADLQVAIAWARHDAGGGGRGTVHVG
ncbi:hypothetical protein QE364_003094 [Nocardioides zeae]|uniref:Uncharacterized protein n=1 Tax=Nocardioides zeae TaxID=1457234 RepID=A0ACC6IL49_9ACTN|nr:hypothetical protein [Nocardioides zeae]MDR6175134.1 hypothetical protein [Nocardioides zeae]MDR6211373.1 hypothetical protein [Nocardioides zeae]